MSDTVEELSGRRPLLIYAWIALPVAALVALGVMTFYRDGKTVEPIEIGKDKQRGAQDVPIAALRNTLAQQTTLSACRSAITHANTHLLKATPTQRPQPLAADRATRLKAELKLDDDDLKEMNATTFTTLDAAHVETCFLLRDAARSLEVAAPGVRGGQPVKPTPLDRARLAFDWVCRQVRLESSPDPLPAPPAFVLKRGSGTAVERATVFVALLEQFGLLQDDAALQGCLLFVPGRKKQPDFWACGVVPGNERTSMYLFDPRLGLPLPGPKGEGIATLKQAREDETVLGQLKVGDVAYDVTPAQAKGAEAAVYAPLSALAPRMRVLQGPLLRDPRWQDADGVDHPLPPAVRVKLAEEEPGAIDEIRRAFVASGGAAETVRYWADGGRMLRSFLRKAEGGAETITTFTPGAVKGFASRGEKPIEIPRLTLQHWVNVPWEDFPQALRQHEQLASDTGPGMGLRWYFAGFFLRWLVDVNTAREKVIRGQFDAAAKELNREQEYWESAKGRANKGGVDLDKVRQPAEALPDNVRQGVEDWVRLAFAVYAQQPPAAPGQPQMTAETAKLYRWREQTAMDVLMSAGIGDARGAQVTFQAALCNHERAARAQARLEMAARAGVKNADDEAKARQEWAEASSEWRHFLNTYPKRAGTAAAWRMLGEARLYEGQPDEAKKAWTEAAGLENGAAKLGLLWRVRKIE